MPTKPLVVIGMLGSTLDAGWTENRWERWRPTVALGQQDDLIVARLELLHQPAFTALAEQIAADVRQVSPETEVSLRSIALEDAWDFERVYATLHDFAQAYPFQPEREDYLLHITTGTHVVQICWFLLSESREVPARLIQTSPSRPGRDKSVGTHAIIDLDLSKYDRIASRFQQRAKEAHSFLKAGIETRNAAFNQLIERIEQVAIASREAILLMGPTGAGKSQLARRIYELKRSRRQLEGEFVDVNCATLRGDAAMSTLFGHLKGAFTGAMRDRPGLLKQAHRGLLFLDEIGELGVDEQAMLLRAVEERVFYPVGSDHEARSEFQLIAGTNRDLTEQVARGRFREDLLARINLWTFQLPALRDRREDIEPNLDFELERLARTTGMRVSFNREARERFLSFAHSPESHWPGNFRDFTACLTRMATLASGGRIDTPLVEQEMARLRHQWRGAKPEPADDQLRRVLGEDRLNTIDPFDRVQLAEVVRVCGLSPTLSEAGRTLFAQSRQQKKSSNDADRLKKYLARFGLDWRALRTATT
jgi:transcriptional regulatory protein RtcR